MKPVGHVRTGLRGRLALVAACCALLACGGRRDEQQMGSFIFSDYPGGKKCIEELEIGEDEFASTISCELNNQTVGRQRTGGLIVRNDTRWTVQALRSSCHTLTREPQTWFVTIEGNVLRRTIGNVTQSFQRGRGEVSGVEVLGCFNPDLTDHMATDGVRELP